MSEYYQKNDKVIMGNKGPLLMRGSKIYSINQIGKDKYEMRYELETARDFRLHGVEQVGIETRPEPEILGSCIPSGGGVVIFRILPPTSGFCYRVAYMDDEFKLVRSWSFDQHEYDDAYELYQNMCD